MLSIKVIEEFHSLLLKLPRVADSVSAGSYSAMAAAEEWLSEAEKLSERHRLPICADFALIRGRIRNYLPAQNGSGCESGRTARLMKRQNGIECLKQAKECIEQYFSKIENLIFESSVLCRKLAAVAVSKGYVKERAQSGGAAEFTEAQADGIAESVEAQSGQRQGPDELQGYDIAGLIEAVQKDAELMPALTNVIGTVGYENACILLKKELQIVLP